MDVATAPNDGLNPSLILTVKGIIPSQYLFNVPEGFSRFVLEHKLRPGLGLRGVFLTGLGNECHGLPGLLMRLRGEGHGAFELFGPRECGKYVEALTHVCFWKNPSVLVSEIDPKPSANSTTDAMYEDENIIVHPIVQGFDGGFQESRYDKAMVLSQLSGLAPSPCSTEHCIFNRCYGKLENSRQGNIWARTKTNSGCKKTILGYLCLLKETQDMILVSGLLDRVDQVKELVQHPLVLECSTDTSKRRLTIISSPFTREEIMDAVHLEGCDSLMAPDSDSHTHTTVLVHTVASACRHPGLADHRLGFDSTAKVSSKLNAICPYMFPLPFAWKHLLKGERLNSNGHGLDRKIFGPIAQAIYIQSDEMQCVNYESSESINSLSDLKDNQRLRDFIDVPALRCLQDETKTLMQTSFKGEKTSNLSAAKLLKDRILKRKRNFDTIVEKFDDAVFADMISGPCVTFFGTGSAEPSKYRGPSGILVDVPGMVGKAYVLLDCGEGTFGQMVRLYGFQGARDRVSKLKLIWISHRHADHMSGLAELLSMRPRDSEEVLIQGPKSCIRWILGLRKLVDFPAFRIEHVSDVDSSACNRMLKQIGGATIQCTPVRHCADAYAVSFVFSDSFKLVYSGDTEPCDDLVRDGEGADLLIHEATFEPEMIQDARRKRHSTLDEAVNVSDRMNASRTVLTHFSQRYPKFPTGFPENGSKVGIAFDGFCLPLKLIDSFPKYMVFFQQMLKHAEE